MDSNSTGLEHALGLELFRSFPEGLNLKPRLRDPSSQREDETALPDLRGLPAYLQKRWESNELSKGQEEA